MPLSTTRLSAEKRQLLELMLQKRGLGAQGRKIPRRPVASPCRASFGQQRVWFQAQKPDTGALYHVLTGVRLHGTLDRAALAAALDAIVARHEVLRTTVVREAAQLLQVIGPATPFALQVVDLSTLDPQQQASALLRETVEEATAPFDLTKGPLIRGRLIRLSEDEHALVVIKHRIVCDGWSKGVFNREFGALYSSYRDQVDSPLPALELQYADFAHWQCQTLTQEVLQRGLDDWRQRLAGAPPVLDLPTDRPRPAARSHAGASHAFAWSAQLTSALKTFARQQDVTLFMVLYAGWVILLSRLSGQRDIVVGSPMANRQRAELEGLIGTFVNQVPLRAELRDDLKVSELLQQVKEATLAAYAQQWVPFDEVVASLQLPRETARHPVFQVSFMLLNTPQDAVQLSGLTLSPHEVPLTAAEYELSLNLQERGDSIVGALIYMTDLFDPGTIASWIGKFQAVCSAMLHSPASPLGALPVRA